MDFTRSDTFKFYFKRIDANGEVIPAKADEVWFTVKKDFNTKDVEIQKKLSNGTITFDENDYSYHVAVQPVDTAHFIYSHQYVYDIQILQDSIVKTISKGRFTVQPEVTFERGED